MSGGLLMEVKTVLKSLVISSPNGITIDQLQEDFKQVNGKGIPYSKLGFQNLSSFLNSITDTLVVAGRYVYAKSSAKTLHVETLVAKSKSNKKRNRRPVQVPYSNVYQSNWPGIPNQIRFGIFPLMPTTTLPLALNMSTLYPATNFQLPYQKPCIAYSLNNEKPLSEQGKKKNKLSDLNKEASIGSSEVEKVLTSENAVDKENTKTSDDKKVEILTSEIPSRIHSSQSKSYPENKFCVPAKCELDKTLSIASNTSTIGVGVVAKSNHDEDYTAIEEAVPYLSIDDIVFRFDYPEGVVQSGTIIPHAEFEPEFLNREKFLIFVTEVHNPNRFWFHFSTEDNELDSLMHDIEIFYKHLPFHELQLKLSNAIPGQICCALYNGHWHRAEILEIPIRGNVKIFYIDYGTVSTVTVEKLKYLMNEFAELPCQARRGSLAFIKPIRLRWTRLATNCFLTLASDLRLYAEATEVDENENVVKLIIFDTNGKTDILLNDVLVSRRHARCIMSQNSTLENHNRRDEFPTFEMLEKGQYPSFGELGRLLAQGLDYESLEINKKSEENLFKKLAEKTGKTVRPPRDDVSTHNNNPFLTY